MKLWIALFMAAELIGAVSLMQYASSPRGNEPKTALVTPSVPLVLAPQAMIKIEEIKPIKIIGLDVEDADTLRLNGEISENAVQMANLILDLKPSDKPLWLLINSPGGSVLDGAALLSAMQASKRPINTVCMQICASMAAVIHQYGVKRYMNDRAILMFHDAAGGASGYVPHMKAQIDLIDHYFHKMDDYIAKRAGTDPELFKLKCGAQNVWLDSDDAIEQHFSEGSVALHINGRAPTFSILFIKNKKSLDYRSITE